VKFVSPKNTYEKLGIQMETYEFCKKQSLVIYINYGQDMNNYGFFLAKIHTMVTKQSPVWSVERVLPGKNVGRLPYFEEKKVQVAIFRQWVPSSVFFIVQIFARMWKKKLVLQPLQSIFCGNFWKHLPKSEVFGLGFPINRVPAPAGRQKSVGLQTKTKLLSYLSCNQIWLHLYMNCCYYGYTTKVGKKIPGSLRLPE